MPGNAVVLRPGEALVIVAAGGPVDPGYSPPWAQIPPGGPIGGPPRPWGPIHYPDQGLPGNQPYPDQGLPGNQPYPDQGLPGQPPRPWGPIFYPDQGLPGSQPRPDQGLPPFPNHPIVIPPTEPPPVKPPTDGDDGTWVWAWSPQAGRWVWVKVPGEGEAGPKEAA